MSYSVLRVKKIKSAGVTGIQIHNERQKDSLTNPDIDKSKTAENYELHNQSELPYRTRIKNRIDQLNLKRKPRKDATLCMGFITTSDREFFKSLTKEQSEKFFKAAYEFLKDKYGAENIISAKVHMDEATPHMHTYIVPVTDDGRLSARDLFTPKSLRELQDEFHEHMTSQGFQLERGKRDSKAKHLDEREFKLEARAKLLNDKENALKSEINAFKDVFKKSEDIMAIKPEKSLIGTIKGVSLNDIAKLKAMALSAIKMQKKLTSYKGKTLEYKAKYEDLKAKMPKQLERTSLEKLAEFKKQAELEKKALAFDRLPPDIKKLALKKLKHKELER